MTQIHHLERREGRKGAWVGRASDCSAVLNSPMLGRNSQNLLLHPHTQPVLSHGCSSWRSVCPQRQHHDGSQTLQFPGSLSPDARSDQVHFHSYRNPSRRGSEYYAGHTNGRKHTSTLLHLLQVYCVPNNLFVHGDTKTTTSPTVSLPLYRGLRHIHVSYGTMMRSVQHRYAYRPLGAQMRDSFCLGQSGKASKRRAFKEEQVLVGRS